MGYNKSIVTWNVRNYGSSRIVDGPGRIHIENSEKSYSMLNGAHRTSFTMVDDFIVRSNVLFQTERKPHAVQT